MASRELEIKRPAAFQGRLEDPGPVGALEIPDEVIEHAGIEGLEADYSPESLVEPEFIKEQPEVQPK